MRKTITFLLAFSLTIGLTSPFAFAIKPLKNGDDVPKNVIKLKPIALALGIVALQYERAFGPHISAACDVSLLAYSIGAAAGTPSGTNALSYKLTGFGISPEFRYYPANARPAPKGFFVAPFIEFYSLSVNVSGTDATTGKDVSGSISGINAGGGGALLGWQFLIGNVFSIDINAGFRYLSLTTPSSYEYTVNGQNKVVAVPSVSASGIGPAGNIALGFAF